MLLTNFLTIHLLLNLLLTSLFYFYSVFSSAFLYVFAGRAHHIETAGHAVKELGGLYLNTVYILPMPHELFYALPAVGPLGRPMPFGNLAARRLEHISQPPGRQLAGPDGNRYGAPGNFFVNQLHRLLSWAALGQSVSKRLVSVPPGPFQSAAGIPLLRNRQSPPYRRPSVPGWKAGEKKKPCARRECPWYRDNIP